MESQKIIISNSAHTAPLVPFYTSYHTPPYTYNSSSWPEAVYQSFIMNEDVLQMQQQLRFPTPPMTPPRGYINTTAEFAYAQPLQESAESQNRTQQQRTKSVIMKIGRDKNSQYLTANLPYENFTEDSNYVQSKLHEQDHHHHDQQQLQSHNDTPSSGNSSPTSHNVFICEWIDCGRYFDSLDLLAHHVTLIHAVASLTDGLYYCQWKGCQRTERGFNARYKMLVHVRTHTKEKPHLCHLCEKRFSRAENLKIHIRSHSGEKPYICTFEGCKKAYSNSSDRFKHTRTHSMEKPYMCKVSGCQKRYTDPSSLRKHVKTFKHSVQILDFKASTNVQQIKNIKNAEDECSFQYTEANHNRPYLMFPNQSSVATTHDSVCMAMEEMCHIKATFNCYSSSGSTPAGREYPYWLHQEAETKNALNNIHPLSFQQTENYTMQLDLPTDKPLDLRVKNF